jgi:hypothetical protein
MIPTTMSRFTEPAIFTVVVKNCFTKDTWFIEHSLDCRVNGTIGTCEFNHAIVDFASWLGGPPNKLLGRWLITGIDSEGLPNLEATLGEPEDDR